MSKYDALWRYVAGSGQSRLELSFEELGKLAGVPIDHSFLRFKKELPAYGYRVERVSIKGQTVAFIKVRE